MTLTCHHNSIFSPKRNLMHMELFCLCATFSIFVCLITQIALGWKESFRRRCMTGEPEVWEECNMLVCHHTLNWNCSAVLRTVPVWTVVVERNPFKALYCMVKEKGDRKRAWEQQERQIPLRAHFDYVTQPCDISHMTIRSLYKYGLGPLKTKAPTQHICPTLPSPWKPPPDFVLRGPNPLL